MAKLKFTIHPLFIIFGIYFAFCGKVFSFLVFTLSALVHEMGHAVFAGDRGYKLNRIVLMPYGAVISGDTSDMPYNDEVIIALAGPFTNLCVAILFVSLWWFVPDTYVYTDLCVTANITLAAINLLPAFPLDGGRVLLAILSSYMKRKTAIKISSVCGIISSVLIFGLFVWSIVTGKTNFSILFFGLFMLFGNIFVSKENVYVRTLSYFTVGELKRPKKINKIALSDRATVRDLMKIYRYGELTECIFYNGEKAVLRLNPEQTVEILKQGNLNGAVVKEWHKISTKNTPFG